ncbi:Hypothetical predicted protein [Cloeon dipterum]|uniref:Sister chromatid cohesion protein DCC1 n=1 Tax=Cloeon dipterum TaxID=197152 RepID=A0A8S1CVC3_9INSE|nr:Hypothetical predicted protein [Cloeon dipterum]
MSIARRLVLEYLHSIAGKHLHLRYLLSSRLNITLEGNMNNDCPRTREDVEKTLNEAKIKTLVLNPCTQILKFSEEEAAYTCLELNKELLETLESGQCLVIRGDKSENAVLCTINKTFELKDTETSNSLLIIKSIDNHSELKYLQDNEAEGRVELRIVDKLVHNYLEPRLCRPHLQIVRQLLNKQIFKGQENERNVNTYDLYSFDKLLTTVQASEEELLKELKDLNAIEYNGFWRLLDFEYHFRVFSFITTFIEQESIPLDKINMEMCSNAYEEIVPKEIFEQVFKYYTEPSENMPGYYSLNQDKVCRMVAESLLKDSRKFNLDEFLPVWQESVLPGNIQFPSMRLRKITCS